MQKQYQPMDTAPKDGSPVFIVGCDSESEYECVWDPEGTSLGKSGRIELTGCWMLTDRNRGGGWFEPQEAVKWRPLTDKEKADREKEARMKEQADV
jgi:hypothetical protein